MKNSQFLEDLFDDSLLFILNRDGEFCLKLTSRLTYVNLWAKISIVEIKYLLISFVTLSFDSLDFYCTYLYCHTKQ